MNGILDPAPEAPQVRVVFTTTEADLQLPDNKRQLIVPSDIRRYGLSRILNSESMLGTAQPIPFDFLVNGIFLKATLADYLQEHGLSPESTVNLQYVRSLIPPVFEASFQHDDWVSTVDVASPSRLLSGSYDGILRLWNASGRVTATSPGAGQGGHTAAIKAARFVTPTQIASAGLDRTVRIWKCPAVQGEGNGPEDDVVMGDDENDEAAVATLKPTLELLGHKNRVDALAVDGSARRVLTASADGTVGVWTTSKTSAPAIPEAQLQQLLPDGAASNSSSKRRKVAPSDVPRRGPLALISMSPAGGSSFSPVTGVVFDPRDRTVGYAAATDHRLATLDLTTGQAVNTLTTSHPLLALCALSRQQSTLLAAGNAARNVVLVDPRISVATTTVMTLRGHVNKVVALAASPESDYSLVSASHDGTCRIWDLRGGSSRQALDETTEAGAAATATPTGEAVYVIDREGREGKKRPLAGEGVKVFDVLWDKSWGIVSGGEDRRVQINRGRNVVAETQ